MDRVRFGYKIKIFVTLGYDLFDSDNRYLHVSEDTF